MPMPSTLETSNAINLKSKKEGRKDNNLIVMLLKSLLIQVLKNLVQLPGVTMKLIFSTF